MSEASKGLRAALLRTGSSVVAIAELPTADLLAGMSDTQKAEMSAALASPAKPGAAANEAAEVTGSADEGAQADGGADDEGKEEGEGDEQEAPAAAAAASADRIKVVAAAVASDEACKGKAGLALAMLADDDYATLSGAAMVKIIGKTATADGESDPEAAQRAVMLAALDETQNSGADASGGNGGGTKANSGAVWDKAVARISKNNRA